MNIPMLLHLHLAIPVLLSIPSSYGSGLTTSVPNPLICEDSLDGTTPFNSNNVPCLLGCGVPVAVATGSLLPGSVNVTDIPYCQLNCVHKNASPAQSSAAPGCYDSCHKKNQATPENIGWCMYWCVEGYVDIVESTACVPSLAYGPIVTSTINGLTLTFQLQQLSPNRLNGRAGMRPRLFSRGLAITVS
ncbi:hypothetical protein HD806DRAFT_32387 [Xylariaceae sp. AK1471]|nr:hypothetical protein HD806DRAFT_32387 [Xylariaceae sp. AK1471]